MAQLNITSSVFLASLMTLFASKTLLYTFSESKKLYKSKAKRTRKKLFEIWSIVQHRALQ